MTTEVQADIQAVTPKQLREELDDLVTSGEQYATMIWGPPGIGKSSIVAQVAGDNKMMLIDVRISQLAPTDLRGLPVPEAGVSRWFPPEFLPRVKEHGPKGILFLDELNMAAPVVQGVAQQLVLDRRVGTYTVPDGWFVWAAGNRKADKATVHDMPAPLANRFLHYTVKVDFDNWKEYAILRGVHEHVIAFLSMRPALLHKMDALNPAWPSPRSWEVASRRYARGRSVTPAIGDAVAGEFEAYVSSYKDLPDLAAILDGHGAKYTWPKDPSKKYAICTGLTLRMKTAAQAINALVWLVSSKADEEFIQLSMVNVITVMQQTGELAVFWMKVQGVAALKTHHEKMGRLMGSTKI